MPQARHWFRAKAAACAFALLATSMLLDLAPPALADCACEVPDAGGTAAFPPECERGYLTRPDALAISNGLPPGGALLALFAVRNIVIGTVTPGGSLGGEIQDWTGTLQVDLFGIGPYAGYTRTLILNVIGQTHTAPVAPGTTPQDFDTDLHQFFGQIIGDPDFDLLRITGGTGFGLPSPGHTTLAQQSSGDWAVDSFFDITYRVDFVGAPAGPFAGLSGSTGADDRLREGAPERTECITPDAGGTGLFPANCPESYASPPDAPLALGVLGDRSGIYGRLRLTKVVPVSVIPGGVLGGEIRDFTADCVLETFGAGTLTYPNRKLVIPVTGRLHNAPIPVSTTQPIPCDLRQLQGQIVGDPDFDLLRITAGTDFGMPSPGHATMNQLPGGEWWVDSFFDITYRIDFVGAPAGTLSGLSGSTTSAQRFWEGKQYRRICIRPDNGGGTADFPPLCARGYTSSHGALAIENGLPAGSPLLVEIEILPLSLISVTPGGGLGGEQQVWNAELHLDIFGTGAYTGYRRNLVIPAATGETHTAPIVPAPVEQFDTDLFRCAGQLTGDPDFDLLRVTAGTGYGLPSPGHTTLTQVSGGNWNVDSFFDITYRVDFVGALGGTFAGMSGSTTGDDCFLEGAPPGSPVGADPAPPTVFRVGRVSPNPMRAISRLDFDLPVPRAVKVGIYDLAGRVVRVLAEGEFPAGRHAVAWDGRGADGRPTAPGVYFYRATMGGERVSKMVVRIE